jgi:hypothetical protein
VERNLIWVGQFIILLCEYTGTLIVGGSWLVAVGSRPRVQLWPKIGSSIDAVFEPTKRFLPSGLS